MLALLIEGNELKSFMNKLLVEEGFDGLIFREALIISRIRFELDARPENSEEKPVMWSESKALLFNIIRGKVKPRVMKIVLSCTEEKTAQIHKNAKALFMNISFENEVVMITTGCSTQGFSLDKDCENAWDAYVKEFMKENKIAAR